MATITGGSGNDTIVGSTGNDTLSGGDGNDFLVGQGGDDQLSGGAGSDALLGDAGRDHVSGEAGSDLLIGRLDGDTLSGGDDADNFGFTPETDPAHLYAVVDGGSGGDDFDTLDIRGLTVDGWVVTEHVQTADSGGAPGRDGTITLEKDGQTATITYTDIERIICFTPGTAIATPQGLRAVETLRAGDLVVTRDTGVQPLVWAGQRAVPGWQMARRPEWRPILIRRGALGHGAPERDMLVSPCHRMLLRSRVAQMLFGTREVLVAAKHLTGLDGVSRAAAAGGAVRYVHVMCARHEVLLADGAWTESFQPGRDSLGGLGAAQRAEILALFPELRAQAGLAAYGAARRSLKALEARLPAGAGPGAAGAGKRRSV